MAHSVCISSEKDGERIYNRPSLSLSLSSRTPHGIVIEGGLPSHLEPLRVCRLQGNHRVYTEPATQVRALGRAVSLKVECGRGSYLEAWCA